MKHSTFLSLNAAFLLAACHDVTAPEAESLPVAVKTDATPAIAIDDSSDVWISMALEDAGTRLTAGITDEGARSLLRTALMGLAAQLSRGADPVENGVNERERAKSRYAAARATLARLRSSDDPVLAPELDAIGLALDQAERFVAHRR